MEAEIEALLPGNVRIFGINGVGSESGNANIATGNTIPWLQDVEAVNVWESWDVTYRDVFVLNHRNELVRVFNLTDHNLNVSANYDSLKTILIDAATDLPD
jgi:hypothetical protein